MTLMAPSLHPRPRNMSSVPSSSSFPRNLRSRSASLGDESVGDISLSSSSSFSTSPTPPSPYLSSSFRVRHNSVVTAMLSSNTLRDCHQVNAMFTQCQRSDDNQSRICDTARNYFHHRCHSTTTTAEDYKLWSKECVWEREKHSQLLFWVFSWRPGCCLLRISEIILASDIEWCCVCMFVLSISIVLYNLCAYVNIFYYNLNRLIV